MVDDGKIDASGVCVFEMTERVGGRLYSLRGLGPDGDLSVDAGGYRTVRRSLLTSLVVSPPTFADLPFSLPFAAARVYANNAW